MVESPSRCRSPRGRRLLESAGLLLCVLLLVRVLFTEPYSVPTGSMAPVLLGNHRAVDCPRCGYPVRVGESARAGAHRPACPNCGHEDLGLEEAAISRGDQLLVNKSVFDLRAPRRWEMVVFRGPAEPGREFVKRVVGLPGEFLQIRGGDVFIDHDITRKTLAEAKRLRVPVFDQSYLPGPDGWGIRWEASGGGTAIVEGASLRMDATAAGPPTWFGYRHWLLDEHRVDAIRDENGYNGSTKPAAVTVHDFMLECDVEVIRGEGWVALGITDGADDMTAELPVGTHTEGACLKGHGRDGDGAEKTYRQVASLALQSGRTYRVELGFVDRRVTLAIDGRQPFAPVDRPVVDERAEVARPVRIGASGVEVRVHNLRIYRDVHYTDAGRHGVSAPVRLGAGQYFVLGDNSPDSDDSRFWSDTDGGPLLVTEADLVGKPFLVHLPSRAVRRQVFGRELQHQGINWERIRWLR